MLLCSNETDDSCGTLGCSLVGIETWERHVCFTPIMSGHMEADTRQRAAAHFQPGCYVRGTELQLEVYFYHFPAGHLIGPGVAGAHLSDEVAR